MAATRMTERLAAAFIPKRSSDFIYNPREGDIVSEKQEMRALYIQK